MVDFKRLLDLQDGGQDNILDKYEEMNQFLNKVPMSLLKGDAPKFKMKKMLEAIAEEE